MGATTKSAHPGRAAGRCARGVLLAAVVAVGLAGLASASPGKSHAPGIPPGARAALPRAATAIATSHGDSHPYDVEAVRTSHRKAERILGTGGELYVVPPNANVYVVAMRGHFNCNSCSHPAHIHGFAPAAVITLQFLSLREPRNVVFGYGGPYPHLSAGGTPVRL
jgi:hypothetical protein